MEFDLNMRENYWFNEISRIPRGSGNEKEVSDFIVNFAKEHGLSSVRDEYWNVVVDKPASAGYEDSAILMMQAHLDVVCEKNKDTVHDFTKDPLSLYVDEEGWLHADGTTLGADDGYGVAYMLAVLEDDTLPHPPLQCVFTTQEEVGLVGASHLDPALIKGRKLINLDGGGENTTCVSSSGGCRISIETDLHYESNNDPAYLLQVRGLQGGHSGGKIHLEPGNANILAARILKEAQMKDIPLQLVSFLGGGKLNAIPREADVTFTSSADPAVLRQVVEASAAAISRELRDSDSGFRISLSDAGTPEKKILQADTDRILNYIFLMPNGFQHRSMAIEGLTVSSLNLGNVTTEDGKLVMGDLIRSAEASHTDILLEQMQTLCDLLGFRLDIITRYAGWPYREDSPLRSVLEQVLRNHGMEMITKASHGGLECGIFSGMDDSMDIITLGPLAEGAHTPQEKMDLGSFHRIYGILREVITLCR